MVDLSGYIRELILQHECIILPGFGGFETTYQSAMVDQNRKVMLPPTKQVNFRPDFKTGGEVLEKFVAFKLNITPERARFLINESIEGMRQKLRNGEKVLLQGVGIFIPNPGTDPSFEPLEDENYLAESFGLEPLEFTKSIEDKPVTAKPVIKLVNNYRSNTLSFVIAGIIIISVLLTITFILSARFNVQLFNLGSKGATSDLIIIGGNRSESKSDSPLEKRIHENTSVKNALNYKPAGSDTVVNYLLIAASLRDEAEATNLQNNFAEQGFQSEIIISEGIYRLSVGKYTDKSVAIKELERLRKAMNRTVWLLTQTEIK